MKKNIKKELFKVYSPYPYRDYTRKYKCIFIHIPKCAGTSVLNALTKYPRRDHCSYLNYKQADEDKFKEYYKFAFVRNPWSRMVSLYNYLQKGGNKSGDLLFIKQHEKELKSFSSFVELCDKSDLPNSYIIFKQQSSFVFDECDKIQVDFLGRFENINEDFNIIKENIGLKTMLGSHNVATKGDYRELYMNDSVIESVYNIYKKDVKLLNYKFE